MKIALVGRPNVGKSALFNRICQKRISIVDDMEGVTRDRIYAKAEIAGVEIEMIDTGGISFEKSIPFFEQIRVQAEIAIVEADGIIMVVDQRAGLQLLDIEIAKILRKTNKPLVLAVNKVDDIGQVNDIFAFHELGIQQVVAVSAVHGLQVAELLENIVEKIPEREKNKEEKKSLNVAIVGRANVGKSTLINALVQEQRCIVSSTAGTTRDAIDVLVEYEGASIVFIDTAGIRRKHKEKEVVEKFSSLRTQRAIERADICLFVLDAKEAMSSQEKRIFSQIEKLGKGCIIFLNKWDTLQGFRMEHVQLQLQKQHFSIKSYPIVIGSAKTKRNITQVFPQLLQIQKHLQKRVSTPELNQFIEKSMQKVHPPMIMGKRLRVYYMVQKSGAFPRFILFVNYPKLMTKAYKQYLLNTFRQNYDFSGCPLEFTLRGKISHQ